MDIVDTSRVPGCLCEGMGRVEEVCLIQDRGKGGRDNDALNSRGGAFQGLENTSGTDKSRIDEFLLRVAYTCTSSPRLPEATESVD